MLRAVALLLTVATGATGLVYEVTWQRMLATLLGSHAAATASVLAFYLGGLAIGYSLFGAYTRRVTAGRDASSTRELLRSYGVVEASIGAYAIAFELLFAVASSLSPYGPAQPGLAFAWDAALSAALILPGSALMGATVPLLTQALSQSVSDSTRVHAGVYGLNTLGAFVGALSASYFLIPAFGLVGTLRGMGMVNLAAGLCYVALSALWRPGEAQPAAAPKGAAPLRLGSLAAAVCLLGFAMMAVQTALIRMGSISLGASLFTFATVVAVFVLCIALGSLAVGALPRVPAALLPLCAWVLFALLTLLYPFLEDAPYYAHRLRIAFRDDITAFMPYQLSVLLSLLVVIGPAVACSGALLPLCFDRVRRERGELGDAAGRLYGWNTAGSLAGALLGGYALFYWLDLHQIYRVALLALAGVAALLTPPLRALPRRAQPAAWLAAAALLLLALPAWRPERLALGAYRNRTPTSKSTAGPDVYSDSVWRETQVVFFDDDPTASISVTEHHVGERMHRSIVTNGKSDGSVLGDYTTMALTALVPAWLAPRTERAFVVGYGTGVTASELAQLDETKQVIVAEISPGVMAAAPLFDYGNLDASRNAKIEVVQGDAYRVLLRSEGSFDVIASEPSNPWVTGIEMLYSVEFLAAAKSRLSPGGVYCQWFHTYEMSPAAVGLVLRTYASVFEHVAVWYGLGDDLLLLGFDDPEPALDLPRLLERAARPDFQAGFGRAGLAGVPSLLAHELWPIGVLHATEMHGSLHTLLHPRLSHIAAQAFFVAQTTPLPPSAALKPAIVGARNSLLRRYAALRGGLSEGERTQVAKEVCALRPRECATLLAAWHHEVPSSKERDELERTLQRRGGPRAVDLAQLPALADLYGSRSEAPPEVELSRYAREQGERFVSFYHHAVPFHRGSLASLFAHCEDDTQQAEKCATVRREVESRVGPLAGASKLAGAAPGGAPDAAAP